MSIKFPDFQVLVSRSDQIPRLNREGDQTGAAGKIAPQVGQEFVQRQERVEANEAQEKVRRELEREGQGREQRQGQPEENKKKKGQIRGRRIDVLA